MTSAMLLEKIRGYCESVLGQSADYGEWEAGYVAGKDMVADTILDLMGRDQ